MARARFVPPEHPAFAALPVQMITPAGARRQIAVHVRGTLSSSMMPLVCVPGYQRNMSDFLALAAHFERLGGNSWPVVLLDLAGRGRSGDRAEAGDYGSLADARDIAAVLAALGISRAIMLGQGYGGQVSMALAAGHPLLLGGAILLDAGPVTDSRGIVRLRNNLAHVEGLRGAAVVNAGFRRMLAGDYPGASEAILDGLIGRSHYADKSGRARPLHDTRLIKALDMFRCNDVLAAQWPLFDALAHVPIMLLRTQLTDQVRRETFDEMARRLPDAAALTIVGQGSPALFDQREELEAISGFVTAIGGRRLARAG